jgi:hypothetical protein
MWLQTGFRLITRFIWLVTTIYSSLQQQLSLLSLLSLHRSLPGYSLLTRTISHTLTAQELHSLTANSRMPHSQSHIATDGQSVSLGVEPRLGLMTRYLLLFDSYGLVFCGAPSLTRGRVCLLSECLIVAAGSWFFLYTLGTDRTENRFQ